MKSVLTRGHHSTSEPYTLSSNPIQLSHLETALPFPRHSLSETLAEVGRFSHRRKNADDATPPGDSVLH